MSKFQDGRIQTGIGSGKKRVNVSETGRKGVIEEKESVPERSNVIAIEVRETGMLANIVNAMAIKKRTEQSVEEAGKELSVIEVEKGTEKDGVLAQEIGKIKKILKKERNAQGSVPGQGIRNVTEVNPGIRTERGIDVIKKGIGGTKIVIVRTRTGLRARKWI
jgi:hypothetical protein